jgi:glutamate 5-kinase
VAILIGADRLVLLTDTGGLYSSDPRRDPGARLVEEVSAVEELEGYDIGLSSSPLGSGGMRSKVVAAEMATAAGIPVTITSGVERESVAAALGGGAGGTRFQPQEGRVSSFKLWLKYAKPTHGRLVIDEGAELALRERGTSLLPVGVVEVEGEFEAGDAVEVVCDGDFVGKGIVNYSAPELARIKGLKSAEVRERFPDASEEAVHRDRFVLA